MTIYYHVSSNFFEGNTFTPRIPRHRDFGEDGVTPRICVAKTIDGCVTAMPNGNLNFSKLLANTNGILKVFRVDTHKLGINQASIIEWDELYRHDLVRDAYWTEEAWITESFTVPEEDIFYITPIYWEADEVDNVSFKIREAAESLDGDLVKTYYQHHNNDKDPVPALHTIDELEYKTFGIDKDFYFFFDAAHKSVWFNTLNEFSNSLVWKEVNYSNLPIEFIPTDMIDIPRHYITVRVEIMTSSKESQTQFFNCIKRILKNTFYL